VAIVTGARNNLGRAFAIALARNGANIVVHYHRAETQAEAEETASLVRAQGVEAVLVQGDLSIIANIRKMYDVAMNEFGRVDIVVNNAGYIKKKRFVEITEGI
jgi:NAD(P)-dependent dehydrogenase (short-subunit alcohol dehydrogenase family)